MRFVLSEASERLTSMKTNNCHLDLTMKKMYGKITHSLGWSLGLGSGSQMTVYRVQINAGACGFHNVSINSAAIRS